MKPTNDGEVDIHFFGKGNKHRITPLSEEIWKQYNSYCESGYHLTKNPEDLVFYSYRNGRKNKMSSDNVSRILLGCEEKVRTKKSRTDSSPFSYLSKDEGYAFIPGRNAASNDI